MVTGVYLTEMLHHSAMDFPDGPGLSHHFSPVTMWEKCVYLK